MGVGEVRGAAPPYWLRESARSFGGRRSSEWPHGVEWESSGPDGCSSSPPVAVDPSRTVTSTDDGLSVNVHLPVNLFERGGFFSGSSAISVQSGLSVINVFHVIRVLTVRAWNIKTHLHVVFADVRITVKTNRGFQSSFLKYVVVTGALPVGDIGQEVGESTCCV